MKSGVIKYSETRVIRLSLSDYAQLSGGRRPEFISCFALRRRRPKFCDVAAAWTTSRQYKRLLHGTRPNSGGTSCKVLSIGAYFAAKRTPRIPALSRSDAYTAQPYAVGSTHSVSRLVVFRQKLCTAFAKQPGTPTLQLCHFALCINSSPVRLAQLNSWSEFVRHLSVHPNRGSCILACTSILASIKCQPACVLVGG